jgi:hypothetical protein
VDKLFDVIEDELPYSMDDWDRVQQRHIQMMNE